jgi:multidrug efflux system outer membrane protein
MERAVAVADTADGRARFRIVRGLVMAGLLLTPIPSRAQAPSKPKAPIVAQPSPAEAESSEDKSIPEFHSPPVSDPMLDLPPPAPLQVNSWEEAIDLIRSRSPDYIANYQKVLAAEAQTRVALAAVLPTLNAQGAYVHQFHQIAIPIAGETIVTPPTNTLTASGTVAWNIVDPRRFYEVETAKRNVEAVKLDFIDRRRIIAQSVVVAMLQTLANERVAELNRVGLRAALERLALTLTRFQFAQGTQLDIDRARQDVANARSSIVSGDEALREAREALGAALGSTTAVSAPGKLDLEGFEAGVSKTCHLSDDVEQRADIRAAKKRVELAERAITDAKLELSPSISASSTLSHSNVAVLGPLTTWDVGAVLNVPLYDGGGRYGRLRAARAQAEEARQALVSARIDAVIASEQTKRSVAVIEAERDVAREQRDLAAVVDGRTRDGYARGIGTSLDLITSAQALRLADISLAVLDFQVAEARANAVLIDAECVY